MISHFLLTNNEKLLDDQIRFFVSTNVVKRGYRLNVRAQQCEEKEKRERLICYFHYLMF